MYVENSEATEQRAQTGLSFDYGKCWLSCSLRHFKGNWYIFKRNNSDMKVSFFKHFTMHICAAWSEPLISLMLVEYCKICWKNTKILIKLHKCAGSRYFIIFHKYLRQTCPSKSADPVQTAPKGAVWTGSALFAIQSTYFTHTWFQGSHLDLLQFLSQVKVSECLGLLQYAQ